MDKALIGRKEETKILKEALTSAQPEFVAVVGRRRIGKTFLIKQVYKNELRFELTGLQYATKADQLKNFIFAFKNHFADFEIEETPASWLDAFFLLSRALESKLSDKKQVVFLDEIPWMGTKRSGFIQALGWFWNSWAVDKNIVLVICGSAASWMIDKVINDRGGLHNRVTQMIFLTPFTLGETEQFLKSKNIRLNRYQIAQIYMSMGGVPMYLDQLKKGMSAVQNIQNICFSQNGYLRKEFDRLFSSLFDNHEKYIEVIRALSNKKMGISRGEIIKKTKLENGGMLTKILSELNQSGFIEQYPGYGKKQRDTLYRLIDPYSLFYLTFLDKLSAKVDFEKLSDLPNYKSWSGYAFENICLNHIDQIRKALGISGVFTIVSSFFAKAKGNLPGAQIDLVIDRSDQSVNLCEMKFSSGTYEVSKADVNNFENKKQVFRTHTKTKKHLFLSMVTTFGVSENANKLNHVDHDIVLDDLFN